MKTKIIIPKVVRDMWDRQKKHMNSYLWHSMIRVQTQRIKNKKPISDPPYSDNIIA